MAFQVGYWTELGAQQFEEQADGTAVSTFMAMPYGEYDHPVYGKIQLTLEKAQNMAKNIANKVRGQELDIDYDHKQHHGKAAGWVKAGEARDNGLYLTVQWTKKAWKAIKAGEYKYFSPEFHDEWTHPKTKAAHKDVLFGGGITNRPFLKDILPLNLSELFAEERGNHKEGTEMDPKKLRKLLGLPEDATDEQVNAKLAELPDDAVIGAPQAQDPPKEEEDKTKTPEGESGKIAATEGLPEEVIRLMEENPAVKALGELVVGLQKTVETQGTALRFAETANIVKELSEPANGKALPAAVQTQLQKVLLSAPKSLSDEIVKAFKELNKTGYVELGERSGTGEHGDGDGVEATKKFNDKVQEIVTQDKVDYGTAVERAASMHPDLFEAHRQASYAFREN